MLMSCMVFVVYTPSVNTLILKSAHTYLPIVDGNLILPLFIMQDIIEGMGPEAREGDLVKVNYVCRRSNGYFVHRWSTHSDIILSYNFPFQRK